MADRRSMLVKIARVGGGLVAAWLVQRVVDSAWQRTAGHPRPTADDDDTPLGELALATVLTGALVALSRLLASRGAARAATRLLARP